MLSSFNDDDPSSEIDKKIIERYVLALIYFATDGDNWDNDLDFLSNATVCDWPSNTSEFRSMGVHCDSVTGRVWYVRERIAPLSLSPDSHFVACMPFATAALHFAIY